MDNGISKNQIIGSYLVCFLKKFGQILTMDEELRNAP